MAKRGVVKNPRLVGQARNGATHEIAFGRMERTARRVDAQRPRRGVRGLLPGRQREAVIEQPADRTAVDRGRRRGRGEQAVVGGRRTQRRMLQGRCSAPSKVAKRIRLIGPVHVSERGRGALETMLGPLVVGQDLLQPASW